MRDEMKKAGLSAEEVEKEIMTGLMPNHSFNVGTKLIFS